MKTQVKEHCLLGLFSSSRHYHHLLLLLLLLLLCDLNMRWPSSSIWVLNSVHISSGNLAWPVRSHCPVVPGDFISKGTHLRGKQTQTSQVGPCFQPSPGLWQPFLSQRALTIPHCQTILWHSAMAEVLINPTWIGRKTTLNEWFSWSLKFNKQYFLKLLEIHIWSTQEEFSTKGAHFKTVLPKGDLPVGFCSSEVRTSVKPVLRLRALTVF